MYRQCSSRTSSFLRLDKSVLDTHTCRKIEVNKVSAVEQTICDVEPSSPPLALDPGNITNQVCVPQEVYIPR